MANKNLNTDLHVEVAIIGAGPSGLAAAVELRRRGIKDVVVFEREVTAGGIPRHCGHPPFGIREFKRLLTGPQYARQLVKQAEETGVTILPRHSVVDLLSGGKLRVATPECLKNISACRVLIATGVRETPRSARFISGGRPQGILTTGALQSMLYLKELIPFQRPVIVGTELVSFSAILTASNGNIKPVALIESGSRITARHPLELLPLVKRIPIHLNTKLESIHGINKVEYVRLRDQVTGKINELACDGVLFTGEFVPESSLIRNSPLVLDPGSIGPQVNQYGRCSDPAYYATGNLLRPVETAGWCYQEGLMVGKFIAEDIQNKTLIHKKTIVISHESPVKLIVPQKLLFSPKLPLSQQSGFSSLQLRVERPAKGMLVVEGNGEIIWQKNISALPERRILIPIAKLKIPKNVTSMTVKILG